MTYLQLFWISSCVGAALFFTAGLVVARRRQVDRDGDVDGEQDASDFLLQQQLLEANLQRERSDWHRQVDELQRQLAEQDALAREAESELIVLARDLNRQRNVAAKNRESSALLIAAKQEVVQLQAKQGPLERALRDKATELQDLVQAHKEQGSELRELQTQFHLTRKRLTESQASHEDYIRLRTRSDENQFLQSEIARLKTQLIDAQSGGGMIPKALRRRPRVTAADLSKMTLSAALDQTVKALISGREGSVVLADEVGLAVTHTDEHGAALAAFSSLMTSAGDRAHSFAPIGKTRRISIVDEGGAQISIWPFGQSGSRLALVTLSRSPVADARISETMEQISQLINRPRTSRLVSNGFDTQIS